MSAAQKLCLETATKNNPMELPSRLRRGRYDNLSEEQHIGPNHQQAVGGFVRKVRRDIINEILGIENTTGPKACLFKVTQEKCLYTVTSYLRSTPTLCPAKSSNTITLFVPAVI